MAFRDFLNLSLVRIRTAVGCLLDGVIGYDLSTLCGCNEDLYGKPRWWGVTLRFNFL